MSIHNTLLIQPEGIFVYVKAIILLIKVSESALVERVTYQIVIVLYRIINNICPDYLKKTMYHILLTYHVEILDLLTVTNYMRQNQPANFSASPSCTLELPSRIWNSRPPQV